MVIGSVRRLTGWDQLGHRGVDPDLAGVEREGHAVVAVLDPEAVAELHDVDRRQVDEPLLGAPQPLPARAPILAAERLERQEVAATLVAAADGRAPDVGDVDGPQADLDRPGAPGFRVQLGQRGEGMRAHPTNTTHPAARQLADLCRSPHRWPARRLRRSDPWRPQRSPAAGRAAFGWAARRTTAGSPGRGRHREEWASRRQCAPSPAGPPGRGPAQAPCAAMTVERRWDGWGDASTRVSPTPHALETLASLVGPGIPPRDASLADVVRSVAPSRLAPEPGLSTDAEDRIRHARGQDLSDHIALRSGRLPALPDAVARPTDRAAVARPARARDTRRLDAAPAGRRHERGRRRDRRPVGATGRRPRPRRDGRRRMPSIRVSGLATVGAGTLGPALEAALRDAGRRLGHVPQSSGVLDASAAGSRPARRAPARCGFGRIEDLFAGGHLEAPAGALDLPPFPASAAGPDLREVVLGSEGRLGIVTEAILSHRPAAASATSSGPTACRTGTGR